MSNSANTFASLKPKYKEKYADKSNKFNKLKSYMGKKNDDGCKKEKECPCKKCKI
jgi:hypothetical protein